MEREGRQLEYKASFGNLKSIYKAVVAFSNDIGGKIIIGVDNKSRIPTGLTEAQIEYGLEELPKGIFDTISPVCLPIITTENFNDKQCLVVQVVPGQKKPYFIKKDGLPKGVYVRIGAHNKRATDDLMIDLVRESQRKFWDEELTDLTTSDLDIQQLKNYYGEAWDETLLRSDGILSLSPRGDDRVTNGGAIYFHPNPATIFPQAELLFSQFEGDSLAHPIRTMDLSGPLPQLVLRTMQELKPHLVKRESVNGVFRKDSQWQVPEIALRETLLNALLHRKYSIMGATKVALFSDRIEIFSPGNFPGPVDLSQLGNGVSYTRNPRLRQMARKAGLVEKRGIGFQLILKSCEENANPRPKVEEGGDHVKVTLYRTQHLEAIQQLPSHLKALQPYLDSRESLQPKQVSKLLNVSINTARSRLMDLVHLGLMEKKGAGRGLAYHWLI